MYNKFTQQKATCEGCAVLDVSEGRGNWIMACQVKTTGAITINPFQLEIDWSNKNGNFKEITGVNTVFYTASDVIDVFTTTPNFFVIGCSKCSSNPGNYG